MNKKGGLPVKEVDNEDQDIKDAGSHCRGCLFGI